jgi:hypothetical protein
MVAELRFDRRRGWPARCSCDSMGLGSAMRTASNRPACVADLAGDGARETAARLLLQRQQRRIHRRPGTRAFAVRVTSADPRTEPLFAPQGPPRRSVAGSGPGGRPGPAPGRGSYIAGVECGFFPSSTVRIDASVVGPQAANGRWMRGERKETCTRNQTTRDLAAR